MRKKGRREENQSQQVKCEERKVRRKGERREVISGGKKKECNI